MSSPSARLLIAISTLSACRIAGFCVWTGLGSHVVYALQETRRYKVISIDNYHNSSPKALDRVAELARNNLPANATAKDKDSAEIDVFKADLTKHEDIRKVFENYGKGGIWGIIHIAVRCTCP